jgi:7-carboxy-7-deazaguanine synthase
MLICEIFRSIQGEGKNQGRPCTFIRFAGCNLRCSWCDTPQSWEGGLDYSCTQVLEKVRSYKGTYACITGGEPLLQGDDVCMLGYALQEMGYTIDIETNGTIDFRPFQPFASICMDVKCPSSGEKSDVDLLSYITEDDTVKFVVKDIPDCRYAADIIREHDIAGEIFISPVYGSPPGEIASFILEFDLPVRLQLQLHRILGMR